MHEDSTAARLRKEFSIGWAWSHLGLPGRPSKDCHSPFRTDKRKSFSVYTDGQGWERWFDHGEGSGGDVIDLWARAKGISVPEAIKDMAGLFNGADHKTASGSDYSAAPGPVKPIRWPPDLAPVAQAECIGLGLLRGLHPSAFLKSSELGTLKSATVYNELSWILTDESKICAEARRFDGRMYPGERKGFCLPGSRKNWAIGLQTNDPAVNAVKNILLVEGMPDYFAAMQVCLEGPRNVRPVTMLGANCQIGPEALKAFEGTSVAIIPHNDPDATGFRAALHWQEQLEHVADEVWIKSVPLAFDDLNELLKNEPEAADALVEGFQ